MAEAAPSAAPAAQPNGAAPKSTVAPVTPPSGGAEGVKAPGPNATPAEKRRYELLVDGQKHVVEGTDEEIQRHLQMGFGSIRRFEEAKRMKAEADAAKSTAAERAKADTDAYLRELGIDPDEYTARRVLGQVKAATLTPEQRELEELRAERARTQAEKAKAAEEAQKAAVETQAAAMWAQLEPQLFEACKASKLPLTKGTMKKIGLMTAKFLEAGVDLNPQNIVAEVERDEETTHLGRLRATPLDVLEVQLTEEQQMGIARRVSERIRAKRNAPAGVAPEATEVGASDANGQPQKSMTMAEWLRSRGRR